MHFQFRINDLVYKRETLFITILIIGIIGLILRYWIAMLLPTHWDVGHYLYWGKLVLDGKIPFKDFFARHPLYIYVIAISMKIFGYNIIAGIMVSIISSFLTIFGIYKLSSTFFSKKIGLIACVIYAFAPTILTYSTVPDERSLTLLFVSIAIATLVQAFKTQNSKFYVLFGVVMGISFLAYKAVVIYVLTIPILLVYINKQVKLRNLFVLKKTLIQAILIIIGFSIPVLPIYIYYGLMTNFNWAAFTVLGLGGQQESVSHFMFGKIAPLTFKLRIFHVAIREWLYLVIPTVIVLFIIIEPKIIKKYARFLYISFYIFFISILILSNKFYPQEAYGAYEPFSIYHICFLFTLLFFIITSPLLYPKIKYNFRDMQKIKNGNAVLSFWFFTTSFLIALYGVPLVNYYYYLAPVMTILTAVLLYIIISNYLVKSNMYEKIIGTLFVVIILTSAGIVVNMLMNTPMTWRNQKVKTLHKAAEYIKEYTSENEEILTDNPLIALLAGRKVALNIMPIMLYGEVGPEPYDPLPYDPFNLIPNIQEIIEYMESGKVKYIIQASSLSYIIKLHPMLNRTFNSRYQLATEIDGIFIYAFQY